MLILGRETGEAICIGEDIVVTVTGHNGDQVSIGIDAPKDVHILRKELYDRQHDDQGDS